MYLRDGPFDELAPKPSANDLKINNDKQDETANNYQRYILGYTGKILFIIETLWVVLIISTFYTFFRIYTRDAFSVWQNFL